MKDYEYAFLSFLVPDSLREEVALLSKGNMQDAANALEWHIYNGLCQNLEREIKIFNILPLGSYPQYYKKAWIKESTFDTGYNSGNVNLGYCNVKYLRRHSQSANIKKALRKWLKSSKKPKMIFVYTASSVLLKPLSRLKKQYPDIRICTVIADLPGFTNLSRRKSPLLRLYSEFLKKTSHKWMECVDYYVLLTEHMATYLGIQKPYCVMEGIATQQDCFGEDGHRTDNVKTILYAGTLHKRFGVMNLVEAFRRIEDPDYRLQICGVGDSVAEIKNAAAQDTRIRFLGQLPREQILQLQKQATLLVNPRQNGEEFTKYSFPSKNLEYLSSGVPFLAYKLDGIPDEYDPYIHYVTDNSVEALKEKITELCRRPPEALKEHALRAREFVQTFKNELVQTRKIIELIHPE